MSRLLIPSARKRRRRTEPQAIPLLVGPDRWGNYYWRPSKALRPHFVSQALGKDRALAETDAIRLNREVERWRASPAARRESRRRPCQAQSVGEIIARYRAGAMGHMRASTRREALTLLKRIERRWAHEQPQAVSRREVRDWLDEIGREAPQSRRQLALRFRAVWNWALSEEIVAAPSPFGGRDHGRIRVGSGRKRKVRMTAADLAELVRAADRLEAERPGRGFQTLGSLLVVAFACVMRLTDAVALQAGALVRAPARPESEAGGWRLLYAQAKTMRPTGRGGRLEGGREVNMALPDVAAQRLSALLDQIEAGVLAHDAVLFANPRTGRPWSETELGARFRVIRARAREARPAIHPEAQLRDARRSGFVQYALDGATVEWICSISGHTVEEGYQIVEHYLPKTPEQADQAVKRLSIRL